MHSTHLAKRGSSVLSTTATMMTIKPRLAIAVLLLAIAAPASAAQPELRINADTDLRFGTFAVLNSGYRIVSPNGNVQSVGIFSISSGDTSPASFTVSYDRGNNNRKPLDLTIHLVLSAAPVVTQDGVVGRLSSYQTDLPSAGTVTAGQIVEINIPNCRQRVCQVTFNVGARLDVTRNYGGARLEIPIPADVVLISVT